MTYTVRYEKFPVTFPNTLYSLPAEAIYNNANQIIYLQKCSQLGNPSMLDFECQGSPREKTLVFVVVAAMVGDPLSQINASVKFNFKIGDTCINDEVYVSKGLPD